MRVEILLQPFEKDDDYFEETLRNFKVLFPNGFDVNDANRSVEEIEECCLSFKEFIEVLLAGIKGIKYNGKLIYNFIF